jgi:hypothetical protein
MVLIDGNGNLGGLIGGGSSGASYDTDAQSIITAVETADGQPLEITVADAINAFVVGCKTDESAIPGRTNYEALAVGVWRICGARTLAGSFKMGQGADPTNVDLVNGDYDRRSWISDGTKTINTNRNNNADPQNDQSIAVWVNTPNAVPGTKAYIGCGLAEAGTTHITTNPSLNFLYAIEAVRSALILVTLILWDWLGCPGQLRQVLRFGGQKAALR